MGSNLAVAVVANLLSVGAAMQGANTAGTVQQIGLAAAVRLKHSTDPAILVLANFERCGLLHLWQFGQGSYRPGLTLQWLAGPHETAKLTLVVGNLLLHSILLADGTQTGFLEAGQA